MKKRRLLSIVLSLCLVLAFMPQMVFAETARISLTQENVTSDGNLQLENGKSYYLSGNINITTKITIGGTVTLDLNGYTIRMTGNDSVIHVDKGNLTLQDNSIAKTGVITGGNAEGGAGGVQVSDGSFIMEGGTIRDCQTSGAGGGVGVSHGTFTMTGGTIRDCTAIYGAVGDAVASNNISVIYANGGTVRGKVNSYGQILNTAEGGVCTEFYDIVENFGTINGGIFYGGINGDGVIDGCRVTFNNGDSIYATEIVEGGKEATEPTAPTKEDYKFKGWYTDKELKIPYNFASDVTENIDLYAGFELPTLTVPFTTTVKQDGNVEPPKNTIFNLEVVDSYGNELSCDNVTITAESVTTNGAGSYDGKIAFTGKDYEILRMFADKEFVFVKQAEGDYPNWEVDDTVWCLSHKTVGELSVDEREPSLILIYSATIEKSDDGIFYNINEDEPAEKMTFTNTYTKSAAETTDPEGTTSGDSASGKDNGSDSGNGKVSKTDVKSSVKTGDTTNLSLWIVLMLLSGVGIIGVTLFTRRKRTNG